MSAATTSSYLLYELTLGSPAIVSTLAGDPNSVATQPFIPGGAIRGAVAARLVQAGAESDGEELRDLVLSGAVRYLHAYPEIAGARGLPAPAAWRSRKHDPHKAYDLAAFSGRITEENVAEDFAKLWPGESLGAVGAPFVAAAASSGARTVATPRTQARLHQQRDREKGRPWLDTEGGEELRWGAIFAYEYLEAEQVFRGAIQVTAPARPHVERLRQLLDRPLLLGRSRRAGYGGEAHLRFTGEARREYEHLSAALDRDLDSGECFRVLLASAYVGRHPLTGQLDPTALDHELRRRLNGAVEVERRRWSFETIGSFNRKWRLEVPQARAVSAGAVLVLRARQPLKLETLRQVEHEGLGERRVEGFGRVAFLEHPNGGSPIRLKRDRQEAEDRSGAVAPLAGASERDREHIAFLETRIVLAAAHAELARLAADLAREAKRIPTNSLLGRVRTLFRGVRDETSARKALAKLAIWCGEDGPGSLKRSARDKLEKCRLARHHLLGWLAALVPQEGGGQWQSLVGAVDRASSLTGLAQNHYLSSQPAAQKLLEEHAALLSVHLVDTLLATLARRPPETRDE